LYFINSVPSIPGSTLRAKWLIRFGARDVIEVVTHRFQDNSDQYFEHLFSPYPVAKKIEEMAHTIHELLSLD
jgi:hypothetical protein